MSLSSAGNLVVLGTASAAKLSPTGGTATGNGMYLPAANTLAWSTNGSEQMRITSAGNVGIGTSSPTDKLEVIGAGAVIRTSSAASANSTLRLYGGAYTGNKATAFVLTGTSTQNILTIGGGTSGGEPATTIAFATGAVGTAAVGTTRLIIDANGNLGLGVTPSAWRSAAAALQLGPTGYPSLNEQANGSTSLNFNCYESAANTWTYLITGILPARYTQLSGAHAWFTAPSGTAGNTITFTQAMTLDASGLLGIGTTSPAQRLDVTGVANSVQARFGNVATRGLEIGTALTGGTNDATSVLNARGSTNGRMILQTDSVDRVIIDQNGNVQVTGGTLGYGAGSGGAVTQATSRTTGVTLNEPSGAITLVSAAGSILYQSFTVTNSTVAATDTVIVCQKSGTDLYELLITAVAAGSFRISFRTTGGTTTEQPVFNFAVIKAATT
jgi:hypothetical protein